MGTIARIIRNLSPKLDEILNIAPKIFTRSLQSDMENFVFKCFEQLKPFSHEFKKVCELGDSYELYVGEWIREKREWQKYGTVVQYHFLDVIREHGDKIKPFVRTPIKDVFAELVDLTKQLVPYKDFSVRIDIPEIELRSYSCDRVYKRVNEKSIVVNVLLVETKDPWMLELFRDRNVQWCMDIDDIRSLIVLEDIIDYVVELYRKADVELSVVKKHNESIMSVMEELVTPWKIAKELKH